MNIREALIEDIPKMVKLWVELMNYHKDHHMVFIAKDNVEDLIGEDMMNRIENTKTRYFLAENEKDLCGFISCSFRIVQELMVYNRRGYIAETVVSEKYRGQGIGKLLFERAQRWFEEEDADHIELQVSLKNNGAMNFWGNQGFEGSTQHMVKFLKKKID